MAALLGHKARSPAGRALIYPRAVEGLPVDREKPFSGEPAFCRVRPTLVLSATFCAVPVNQGRALVWLVASRKTVHMCGGGGVSWLFAYIREVMVRDCLLSVRYGNGVSYLDIDDLVRS